MPTESNPPCPLDVRSAKHYVFLDPDPKQFKIDATNARVSLPKLGWIRLRLSRDILGTARNITVSCTRDRLRAPRSAWTWASPASPRSTIASPGQALASGHACSRDRLCAGIACVPGARSSAK
jgi:putative transposase